MSCNSCPLLTLSLKKLPHVGIGYRMGSIMLFALTLLATGGDFSTTEVHGQTSPLLGNGLASISTPKGVTIFAEIANTPDKRALGLMFRSSLAPDYGMLFQFPELGYWTFWMKNTKIPLDILWLDATGRIIHIESKVPICTRTDDGCPRYYSHKKSQQVLEIRAGMAKKLELMPGSQLTISLPQNHLPF